MNRQLYVVKDNITGDILSYHEFVSLSDATRFFKEVMKHPKILDRYPHPQDYELIQVADVDVSFNTFSLKPTTCESSGLFLSALLPPSEVTNE